MGFLFLPSSALAGVREDQGLVVFGSTESEGVVETLTLSFDADSGVSPGQISDEMRQELEEVFEGMDSNLDSLDVDSAVGRSSQVAVSPNPPKPLGTGDLKCNQNPTWTDPNGTLSARFNCGSGNINWGYKISSEVKAIIAGGVEENGATWKRNGRSMPQNAPHGPVDKGYHFHGTLTPVADGDRIEFSNILLFRVNVSGQTGDGSILWSADVRAKK